MRDDLLDADAAIGWVRTNWLDLEMRMFKWLKAHINIAIEELPPPAESDVVVALENEPFPPFFNVEVGAYINSIRSSLDMLATSLAHRHSLPNPEKMSFPIASSESDFLAGRYNGSRFLIGLPSKERAIIEALKPYQEGNPILWTLHQLDIERKHRRLIDVEVRPARFSMLGKGISPQDFTAIATASLRVNEKTVLCLIRKGAPKPLFNYEPVVTLSDPGLMARKPVIEALLQFMTIVSDIITRFDY